jgi:leucyl/phenylalanyl-tRNA---protein transferase
VKSGQKDLDPDTILRAYARGLFPMADSRTGPISWYSPDPRAVIPLENFHVPRSVRRTIRKGIFAIRVDSAFEQVISGCAMREETWISDEVVQAYTDLFRRGYAHSVEAWRAERLVGGLYGVSIRGAFFGESMFSRESGASKVALAALVRHLRKKGFVLLDTQLMNEHIRQFGAVEIPRNEYLSLLGSALTADVGFGEMQP